MSIEPQPWWPKSTDPEYEARLQPWLDVACEAEERIGLDELEAYAEARRREEDER